MAQIFCFHIAPILILIWDFWVNFGYILSENIAVIWSDIHYVIWKFGKKSRALFWTFIGENKCFLNIFKVFSYEMWPFHLPKVVSKKNINILLWKQYFSNHFFEIGALCYWYVWVWYFNSKEPRSQKNSSKNCFFRKNLDFVLQKLRANKISK